MKNMDVEFFARTVWVLAEGHRVNSQEQIRAATATLMRLCGLDPARYGFEDFED
jgi:hypothetical protein